MKKILSIVLAAAMVASLSVTSFAATPEYYYVPAKTLDYLTTSVATGDAIVAVNKSGAPYIVEDDDTFGDLATANTTFPSTALKALVPESGYTLAVSAGDYEFSRGVLDGDNIKVNSYDLGTIIVDKEDAATFSYAIDGDDFYSSANKGTKLASNTNAPDWAPLTALDSGLLPASQIRKMKLGATFKARKGKEVIKSVEVKPGESKLVLTFIDEFVSTGDKDFDLDVTLTIDGKAVKYSLINLVGTIANTVEDVSLDDDELDFNTGIIYKATEPIPAIDLVFGNVGATVHTKFFENKKYYGVATRESDVDDITVYADYPEIDNVITFKTVGVTSKLDTVTLDTDYDKYFIYDDKLNYLGKGTEVIPFARKLYLATSEISAKSNNNDAPAEIDDDEPEEIDVTPSKPAGNTNNNPGTGR